MSLGKETLLFEIPDIARRCIAVCQLLCIAMIREVACRDGTNVSSSAFSGLLVRRRVLSLKRHVRYAFAGIQSNLKRIVSKFSLTLRLSSQRSSISVGSLSRQAFPSAGRSATSSGQTAFKCRPWRNSRIFDKCRPKPSADRRNLPGKAPVMPPLKAYRSVSSPSSSAPHSPPLQLYASF